MEWNRISIEKNITGMIIFCFFGRQVRFWLKVLFSNQVFRPKKEEKEDAGEKLVRRIKCVKWKLPPLSKHVSQIVCVCVCVCEGVWGCVCEGVRDMFASKCELGGHMGVVGG